MIARTLVNDESLRDGLQSPSVHDPDRDDKIALLYEMAAIGVDAVSVGLPAASARAVDDAAALLAEIQSGKLGMQATAAARTTEGDVEAIARVSQRAGASVDVYAFIGSSPIRHYVESWDDEFLRKRVTSAAEAARRAGLPFCLVTEDTTRAHPSKLATLWSAAIDAGATRLCLCDTVGHADPHGVDALVGFVKSFLQGRGATHVKLDWHGHEDRGLGLANALHAASSGVERIHGTALGVGERVGNVSMESLIYNLAVLGRRPHVPLAALRKYSDTAARAMRWMISPGQPLVGRLSRGIDAERAAPCVFGELPSAPGTSTSRASTTAKTEPTDGAARHAGEESVDEGFVAIRTRINGDPVETFARPSRTLLEMLRYDLDLVGTRQGCDKGDCGACTVLIDGEPHLSCLTLAASCDEREVTTVESLEGPPDLDPLLDAFDRCGAGQCGFCTPGMLMTATALLNKTPAPTRDEVRLAISGNLCRCTGYGAIVTAIDLAAKIRAGKEPSGKDLPGAFVPPALEPMREKRK